MVLAVKVALLLGASELAHAHRPFPLGIHCGQFNTSEGALIIPNPEISWSTRWIATCDNPVLWLKGEMNKGFKMEFTSLTPNKERFKDVRVSVLTIGPGLPTLTEAEKARVPAEVLADIKEGEGAVLKEAPEDQTTCAHLASPEMSDACGPVKSVESAGDRCHFHEPYGDSHSWVLLDENVTAAESGMHRFAIWNPKKTTAKLSFACCAWPEDWAKEFPMQEVDCPYCGTSPDNSALGSWWSETKSMTEYGGFPELQDCNADAGPAKAPAKCPPKAEAAAEEDKQPESCKLGCLNGECHSHNIFGECSYKVHWITPFPTLNGAKVTKLILFKGDKVNFGQPMNHQMVHNMFDITSAENLAQCDFTGATEIANVEHIKIGKEVIFEATGTHYFTCGIACYPNMGGDCHCKQGQVITIEVKDSAEGMQCHDHFHVDDHGHDHDDDHSTSSAPAACQPDQVVAFTTSEDYGAADGQCSQMCTSESGLAYMAGVKKGSCAEQGFEKMIEQKEVQPPGSPMKTSVTIMGKETTAACGADQVVAYTTSSDYGAADGQCSQMCTSETGLAYMAGVQKGSCADQGFEKMIEQKEVQPPGSPMKTSVTIMGKETTVACGADQVVAYTTSSDYGAADGQCSQMCTSETGLAYMAGVQKGSCADQGFDTMLEQKEVQPPGSPMKTSVTIMTKGEKVSKTCHCHSYEEIKCDAAGDALYAEHIEEITQHCAGIIDGSESICPYNCFQPFEVLHLTYLECTTRPKHELYKKIDATGKCHQAAKPPYGKASECPVVDPAADGHTSAPTSDHEGHDHDDHGHDHDSVATTTAQTTASDTPVSASVCNFSAISFALSLISLLVQN
jgi:hypothetical protein